jgi:hypothetical protein
MARQAGIQEGEFERYKGEDGKRKAYMMLPEELVALAALVAAAEREEIDKLFDTDLGCCDDAMGQEALNQMRAAIKARGETK